jgi:hypothetical protein
MVGGLLLTGLIGSIVCWTRLVEGLSWFRASSCWPFRGSRGLVGLAFCAHSRRRQGR